MAQYLLLLYDDPADFSGLSPEEMQRVIEKYKAWTQSLKDRGLLVGSNKLKDDAGKVLRREGGKQRVTDGPFSEAKEVLGGYYLIEAESYDQAIDCARECPHLEFGPIALREIDFV